MGPGLVLVAGNITDPSLVTIGSGVTIGPDCWLFGHVVTPSGTLMLGEIVIGKGAQIGTGSMIMPGCVIGENSMINTMSRLPLFTRVPPNEIWGGNPAKKIMDMADLERPRRRAAAPPH